MPYTEKIYSRTFTDSSSWGLDDVYNFLFLNQGNKAVTLINNVVLLPGAAWGSTNTNVEVSYNDTIEFVFDKVSAVTDVAGKPGSSPSGSNRTAVPDASPIYRLVLVYSKLVKK